MAKYDRCLPTSELGNFQPDHRNPRTVRDSRNRKDNRQLSGCLPENTASARRLFLLEHKDLFLELCHSVPVDRRKDLKTSSQQKQERQLAICKRIEQLGGDLPMNWLGCELIYLERFVRKLQRNLDRQVIGF